MTSNELIKQLNETYGMEKEWPIQLEVDHETYANCCQEIFDWYITRSIGIEILRGGFEFLLKVGPNNGLMFKNVELILIKK